MVASDPGGPSAVDFLLVPKFSMMAFAAAVEPLRVANRLADRALYRWRILTADGQPVEASNGMSLIADGRLDRSEEHTSELQSRRDLVCRLLLEKKKTNI